MPTKELQTAEEQIQAALVGRNIKKIDKMYSFALRIKEGEIGNFMYCMEEDKFYQYKKGYWEELLLIDFQGKIEENIPEILRFPASQRKQIIENFKTLRRKHLCDFNWSEMINLENGMLSPYDGTLEEHSDTFYSTNRLPFIYDQTSECQLWLKSLNEIMENDKNKINILQEFFGYCLTRDTKQHKALLLLGESRAGKSVILQTLRHVVGVKNCSSVPIKFISNPQYTPMLINKLLNIDTDVSSKAEDYEAEFKTITSGEPLHTNQKYVAAFDFVPYCKIAMGANKFPRITDHSSAFYNRLILIPCDRVFSPEEQNRDLPHQLLGELSGILNWSIEGLQRLTKRGRFEELDFMRDAIEDLENENNPSHLFFEEHVIVDMGYLINKSELYDKYVNWSTRTKNFCLSKERFSNSLYRKYNKYTQKKVRRSDGSRPYVWENLRYVEYKEQQQPERIDWQE